MPCVEPNYLPFALSWSADEGALFSLLHKDSAPGRRYNPWKLSWEDATALPADLRDVGSVEEALRLVFSGGSGRRVPIGIIGPRDASPEECADAEALGRILAEMGLQLICGGKAGVMEAACKGHLEAGGLPIGLLPDEEWWGGNPYVAIPLATGIGPVRNAILSRSSIVLVAVGGGYGTLTEMAYGLHFKRVVLALGNAPYVDGAVKCQTVDEVITKIAHYLIIQPPSPYCIGPKSGYRFSEKSDTQTKG